MYRVSDFAASFSTSHDAHDALFSEAHNFFCGSIWGKAALLRVLLGHFLNVKHMHY